MINGIAPVSPEDKWAYFWSCTVCKQTSAPQVFEGYFEGRLTAQEGLYEHCIEQHDGQYWPNFPFKVWEVVREKDSKRWRKYYEQFTSGGKTAKSSAAKKAKPLHSSKKSRA